MKQFIIVSLFVLLLITFTSCASPRGLDEAYIIALETLIEDTDFEYDIDFISLFIKDDFISDRNVEIIKKHFEKTYEKEIFTYTPDEVIHAGPYGKENLAMNGVFLYLLDINEKNHTMTFKTAKYHTVLGRGAVGMEVVIHKEKKRWTVQQKEVLWRE